LDWRGAAALSFLEDEGDLPEEDLVVEEDANSFLYDDEEEEEDEGVEEVEEAEVDEALSVARLGNSTDGIAMSDSSTASGSPPAPDARLARDAGRVRCADAMSRCCAFASCCVSTWPRNFAGGKGNISTGMRVDLRTRGWGTRFGVWAYGFTRV